MHAGNDDFLYPALLTRARGSGIQKVEGYDSLCADIAQFIDEFPLFEQRAARYDNPALLFMP
jgi:hypothetical protein